MATFLRPPLIFANWRRDPRAIAAKSQDFLQPGFPPLIPPPPDTDHFPRGPLFARVEARRSIVWQDFTDPSNLALLTAPAPLMMPVPNGDWPNPRGPQRSLDLLTWTQEKTQEAAAVVTVNPGFNEWAVPDGPRWGRQDWIAPSNIALLAAPAVQMPLNQYDWPLPSRAPQRSVTLLTHTDSFKLPLQQDLPAGEREQILPVRAVLARPDWQRYTLPWAQAPPLRQNDWPVPRGPLPTHLRTWTDSFKLPLQQTLPPHQTDWPNPILRTVQRQDCVLSTSIALNTEVLSDPAFNSLANPLQVRRSQQDWVQATSIALAGAVQPPFFETEWPNPVLRIVQRRDWTDSFKLPLQQTQPPHQTDWANPILRTVRRPDWILPQPYALNVVVVTDPFVPRDWPNPRGPLPARFDWLQPKTQEAAAVVTVNPGFNEWAVPSGPLPRLRPDWIFPQPFTLNVVVVTNPIVPIDWPNPRGARRGPQDWIQATSIALSTAVQPPFFQTDWPNPRAARPTNRDWQDWFKLPLQQTLPPRQLDWPNPGRRKPPVVADWIQGTTAAQTFVQAPFAQKDWPNPGRRKVSLLPTWTDAFKLPLQQTLPPRQLDWPVPKGPRQPVVTTYFYAGIKPEQPIPPVYDSANTIKNEIRRLRFLDNLTGRVRFLKNEIRR